MTTVKVPIAVPHGWTLPCHRSAI